MLCGPLHHDAHWTYRLMRDQLSVSQLLDYAKFDGIDAQAIAPAELTVAQVQDLYITAKLQRRVAKIILNERYIEYKQRGF